MATIVFEGISFNKEWAASKTLKEFCEHEKHHGLSTEQLKEVWNICKGKKDSPPGDEKGDAKPLILKNG